MDLRNNLNAYLNVLSLVALAVVGFYVVRSKVKNENIKDLKDRVAILEEQRKENRELIERERDESRKQHLENQKAIANLEGQLATYKDIPLKSIAQSLETLPKLVSSNEEILETLKGSAKIAKSAQANGGLLVKTKVDNPLDVKPVEE